MTLATFEREGNVGVITICNPPLNLYTRQLIADLRQTNEGGALQRWCPGLPLTAMTAVAISFRSTIETIAAARFPHTHSRTRLIHSHQMQGAPQ